MANVLMIGATSAIASAMAERLAGRGDKLFLIARDQEKLNQLEQKLDGSVAGSCSGDFTDYDFCQPAIDQAFTVLGGVDTAILAHGYIGDQIRSETDFLHSLDIFEANFTSMVAFLIPLSSQFLAQGRGKIAVMASVAGDRGRPRNFTYGSAKAALASYLEGLRSVLWGSGVEVYTFKLGPVVTPMTKTHRKNFSFSSIDKVVDIMLSTLEGRRYVRYVPGFWFWVMLVVRNLPEPIYQKIGFLSGR